MRMSSYKQHFNWNRIVQIDADAYINPFPNRDEQLKKRLFQSIEIVPVTISS